MGIQSISGTDQARTTAIQEPPREGLAASVIKEMGPILATFGFTQSEWGYDKDLDIVRVSFEDPSRSHAVQIDCNASDDSCTPNYCRYDEEWEICRDGKPKSFLGLKKTVGRWLRHNCEECCIDCSTTEESWEMGEYS